MTKEELKLGGTYWFLSTKHSKLVKLTFMNKVHHRNAFRFAEDGKKQLFLVHSSRLNKTYKRKWEGNLALKLFKGVRAQRVYFDNGGTPFNPPDLRFWVVARGFPRRVRFGRS